MAGKFEVIKITNIADMDDKTVLPKSDLAVQNNERIVQFKYVGENNDRKKTVKPGMWSLKSSASGVDLVEIDIGKKRLLLDVTNPLLILDEANRFFGNLAVYDQLERPKKRGVLIYSGPGCGKTSTISHFCHEAIKQDPGTVVLVWPTSKVEADDVCDFLASQSKLHKKCTRMILILEDIGGAEYENGGRPRGVDSGLLNLLDGVAVSFKLPTFIIATTNFPENLLASLADRPGRFDLKIELKPPKFDERVKLVEFIAKRPLNDDEKQALANKDCNTFSIAHLEEVVVRSLLHQKTIVQTIREIIEDRKFVANAFENNKGMGFGSKDWD